MEIDGKKLHKIKPINPGFCKGCYLYEKSIRGFCDCLNNNSKQSWIWIEDKMRKEKIERILKL